MIRFISAVLFGSVAMFTWDFISWTVLDWHDPVLKSFNEEERVSNTLQNYSQAEGVYILPGQALEFSVDSILSSNSNHHKGPFAFVAFSTYPQSDTTQKLINSGLLSLCICTLLTLLLMCTLDLTYLTRVIFITLIGAVSAFSTHVPYWNWMQFETNYTLIMIADVLLRTFLAGAAISLFVGFKTEQDNAL